MPTPPPAAEETACLARLLHTTRWVALATARDEEPLASWVAVAPEPDFGGFLLHLSHLALHTRYLETNPRVALAWSEPDTGKGDPQTLARLSLQGVVHPIAREHADYARAQACYLACLPDAGQTFALGDFTLYRFIPDTGRFVPGFGRAHRVTPAELRQVALAWPR